MSKTYLVTFTPKEPYFFGNEKSFIYTGQSNGGQYGNKYYIKSERMPSQSTIFGAIRYLMIPEKKHDYKYEKERLDSIIGESSFSIDSEAKQTFGVIEGISPIFIRDDVSDKLLISTPKNHRIKTKTESKEEINTNYTPFSQYAYASTSKDDRLYAADFNTKDGTADSFVYIDDGSICNSYDLFGSTVRVGINRAEKKEGFFKKEYSVMKRGFSFAVYLTLSDGAEIPEAHTSVYLGQGKSLFEVTFFEKENDTEEKIKAMLSKGVPEDTQIVYCAGDTFVGREVYDKTLFAAVTTKTYRSFTTDRGRVTKGSTLYNIIAAGSVFIIKKDTADTFEKAVSNENAKQIGYNTIIITK